MKGGGEEGGKPGKGGKCAVRLVWCGVKLLLLSILRKEAMGRGWRGG